MSERIEEVVTALQEEGLNDDVWILKAEVFEAMRKLGFYPVDAEGPDHEEELRIIMKRLVEEH